MLQVSLSETSNMNGSASSSLSGSFSDKGIGTSIGENSSSEGSLVTSFEKPIGELCVLREKLLEEDSKIDASLKQILESGKKFNAARLKAERDILLSSLKKKVLLREYKEINESQNLFHVGCVNLSNVQVYYASSDPSPKIRRYFLCAVTRGCSVFLSQICEPNSEGIVNFKMDHTFLEMPTNFEIGIKIYMVKLKKISFRQKVKSKLSQWFRKNESTEDSWRRESLFKLWKSTKVTISHVNQSNEEYLELVNNSDLSKICFDVKATVNISAFSNCGWLDVSQGGTFWNQQWCVLEGHLLKFYTHPLDKTPVKIVNLKKCISCKRVRSLEEFRSHILKLEVDDPCKTTKVYLSSYCEVEFLQWKLLSKIINTLQCWKIHNGVIM